MCAGGAGGLSLGTMTTSMQVWDTYEKIVTEVIEEVRERLEEEDGLDHGIVLEDLKRLWELNLVKSGALSMGAEIDPSAQTPGFGTGGQNAVQSPPQGLASAVPPMVEAPQGTAPSAAGAGEGVGASGSSEVESGDGDRPAKRQRVNSEPEPPVASAKGAASGDAGGATAVKTETPKVEADEFDVDDVEDLDPKDEVLGLVDKKFKNKNKYRFVLKSGIINIKGLEYVFEAGNAIFKW